MVVSVRSKESVFSASVLFSVSREAFVILWAHGGSGMFLGPVTYFPQRRAVLVAAAVVATFQLPGRGSAAITVVSY